MDLILQTLLHRLELAPLRLYPLVQISPASTLPLKNTQLNQLFTHPTQITKLGGTECETHPARYPYPPAPFVALGSDARVKAVSSTQQLASQSDTSRVPPARK